jgi:hypothetical protein
LKQSDGSFSRQNDAPTFYRSGEGVFNLKISRPRGGTFRDWKIKIFAGYSDKSNYGSLELKGKTIESRVLANGKTISTNKKGHGLNLPETLELRATVRPSAAVLEIRMDDKWIPVGSLEDPDGQLTKGKFGIQHVERLIDFTHN